MRTDLGGEEAPFRLSLELPPPFLDRLGLLRRDMGGRRGKRWTLGIIMPVARPAAGCTLIIVNICEARVIHWLFSGIIQATGCGSWVSSIRPDLRLTPLATRAGIGAWFCLVLRLHSMKPACLPGPEPPCHQHLAGVTQVQIQKWEKRTRSRSLDLVCTIAWRAELANVRSCYVAHESLADQRVVWSAQAKASW